MRPGQWESLVIVPSLGPVLKSWIRGSVAGLWLVIILMPLGLQGQQPVHSFGDPNVWQWPPTRAYHVENYKLNLHFDQAKSEVFGDEAITIKPLTLRFHKFYLNSAGLTIDSVALLLGSGGSVALTHTEKEERLWITLDRAYDPSSVLTIRIIYHGFPRTGLYFTNPTSSYPDWLPEIFTQGETEFNHYWFPCWDYPNDMATSETVTTVPEGQSVVSNGRLVNVTHSHGFVTFDWVETVPHSSYLTSIAVGPWHKFSDIASGIPVEYYAAENVDEATVRRSFHLTPDVIGFFSHALEIHFPYEKYAQVAVENDMFGWQENVSATTVSDTALHDERADQDYPSIGGMSHEVGQHLFGDYVQARDWANIWLNEGFATYMEALYLQNHEGNDAYRYAMHKDRLTEHEEDRESYRRSLVDRHYTDTMDMVDATTHVKGAAVLDMLRYLIDGPDAASHPASQNEMFFRTLHSYLVSHHGQSVDAQDLLRCLRDATGMELGWFFRAWVYMAGYPEYEVLARYDNGAKVERVTISQKQQVDAEVPVFEMPIELAFYGKNGESKKVQVNDHRQQEEFEVSLEFEPEWVDFDPEDYIDKTVLFKKSQAELIAEATKDPSMMSRLWAVQQLGLMGDGDPDTRIDAVSHVLETDGFNGVRAAAAASLGEMKLSRAKDRLLIALQQPSNEVRKAVVTALGTFTNEPEVCRRLKEALREDPSYAVEGAAAAAVGRSGMPDAFDVLKAEVLANPEIHVIRASLSALAATQDPRAVSILIAESRPGVDERVRVSALSDLATMKEELQADDEPELAKAVDAALRDSYLPTQQAGEELVGIYHFVQFEAEIKTRSQDTLMPLDRQEALKILEELHDRH